MSGIMIGNNNYMSPYAGGYASASAGYSVSGQTSAISDARKTVQNPGESTEVRPGRKSSPAECETCKNRKYQDGSDEMVSLKSAAHISPEASASRVRAHEQEHVNNAYSKAAQKGGKTEADTSQLNLEQEIGKMHQMQLLPWNFLTDNGNGCRGKCPDDCIDQNDLNQNCGQLLGDDPNPADRMCQ